MPAGSLESSILYIRSQKVILDRTLAGLYGISISVVNQAVKRNPERFPPDFMFQLTVEEAKRLDLPRSKSRGKNTGYLPHAFTEHGILMLSSALNSERVDQVNIEIMRAFVRFRQTPVSTTEITKRLDVLEHNCKIVLDAIRKPMRRAVPKRKQIGFRAHTIKR